MSSFAAFLRSSAPLPQRVLVHGEPGVGKSTLAIRAAAAPALLIECYPESVGAGLEATLRASGGDATQRPRCLTDLLQLLQAIIGAQIPHRALILDGLSHLKGWVEEVVLASQAPDKNGQKARTIEEVGGGYGKGDRATEPHWRHLLSMLEQVRAKGLQVWLVGHTSRVKVKAPEQAIDYEAAGPVPLAPISELLTGWSDLALFLRYERTAYLKDGAGRAGAPQGRGKLAETGPRVIQTQADGAWFAKNRHGMPSQLPLEEGPEGDPAGGELVALYLEADEIIATQGGKQVEARRARVASSPHQTMREVLKQMKGA